MYSTKNKESFYLRVAYLLIVLLVTPVLFSNTKSVANNAIAINHYKDIPCQTTEKIIEDKLPYNFKVSNKLSGDGAIMLSFKSNKIKGTAVGKGKTTQCEVNFLTNIEGALDSKNGDITVSVNGKGDPIGIPIPGKISFHGPLKGYFKDKKLNLVGKVHIEGKLAQYAGFKKTEDLLIEIPESKLFSGTIEEFEKKENLASL